MTPIQYRRFNGESVPDYGLIPEHELPEEQQQELYDFYSTASKWDCDAKPPVTTWDSFKPHLETKKRVYDSFRSQGKSTFWWHYLGHINTQAPTGL